MAFVLSSLRLFFLVSVVMTILASLSPRHFCFFHWHHAWHRGVSLLLIWRLSPVAFLSGSLDRLQREPWP